MSVCDLTTIANVEAYLGTTVDSAETAVYAQIIDAVSLFIAQYCDTNFCDDIYSERIGISDGEFSLKNRLQYFYAVNAGVNTVIDVVGPSALSSINVSRDGDTISLIDSYTKTDIDMSNLSLSAIVTAIGNEAGWSASLGSGVANNYGKVIFPGSYSVNDTSTMAIDLLGADSNVQVSVKSDNVYQTEAACAEGMAIYQGGFPVDSNLAAIVPSDLEDAATRMVINAYSKRAPTTISGEKKEEKVGDYSYKKFTAAELSAEVKGLAVDYYSVLDNYRRYDI